MAAPTGEIIGLCCRCCFTAFSVIFCLLFYISYVTCSVSYIEPKDIIRLVNTHCVVVLFTKENHHYDDVYLQVASAFRREERVAMGRMHSTSDEIYWNTNEPLKWASNKPEAPDIIAVFKQKVVDRACLLAGTVPTKVKPTAEAYEPDTDSRPAFTNRKHSEPLDPRSVLDFINVKCGTYRNLNGELSVEGLHRKHILENLFHVGSISNFTMASWYKAGNENVFGSKSARLSGTTSFGKDISEDDKSADSCPDSMQSRKDTSNRDKYYNSTKAQSAAQAQAQSNRRKMPRCERISVPTWKTFFNDYVKLSRPVVIENAAQHWPAMTKWSTQYLRNRYGKTNVHIKLAPDGNFEGVDKSSNWDDFDSFKIPKKVKDNLPFSDLLVVRPATMNLNFSDFLDMMTGNSSFIKEHSPERVSAYLEYSSITQYFPELEEDIEPFPFVNNNLKRRHLNIWLSDGNTLGKLHFDPFDNLLCQIRGKKELTLFEPHDNTNMYEAHIQEAELGYNAETGKFRRKTLLESTSMVMAPVDILEPDFKRFPDFAPTHPLNCTIDEGDVLFMPAYWWHEVQSYPNVNEHRNVAVNFWYEPFLNKAFPCPTCRLDVNPFYRYLL